MASFLYVFVGGGLGSMCRYAVGKFWPIALFPVGTLTANILSSLILGFLIGANSHQILANEHRLLLATGFCGGFSTFSTFSGEIIQLYQGGQLTLAVFYLVGSIVAGLLAILGGMYLSKLVLG